MQERNGDFRDWRDASGNLIPIYDPATIRSDGQGGFIKDQFMGCDGNTPNVICPSRISPLVRPWLSALPTPTSGGPLNNYLGPAIPDTILGNSDYYMGRFDLQIKNNDHIFTSVWHQRAPAKFVSVLPQSIASETYSDPQNSWVSRLNWDRSFTSNLLNHMSMGYLNRNEGYGSVNQDFVDDFPKIAGVAGYNVPPQMSFSDGFAQFGTNAGVNIGNVTTRPTFIINDSLTWTKGVHTLKVGMEYRKIMGNIHNNGNQAGSFTFGRGSTGLVGVNSGSPIASFLLGAVDSADAAFRAVDSAYPRQNAWIFFGGDTWQVNDKLTFDYGLRWDYYSPSSEKYDRLSFFDPVGPNPGAGGRPGRLAFAGDSYGAASYGARYPEEDFYGGFAPRLGAVYRLNQKTILRSGWGIFYMQAFYPGWGGGISQDGFSTTPSFNTTLGGIQPAFFLEQGLPQNFERPPLIQVRLQERPGSAVPPGGRQQASVLAPVEHHRGPRARAQSVAERGIRRQRGAPAAVEHRAAQRHRPAPPVDGRRPPRRVHPRHDEPERRAASVSGMGGADDRLCAVGRTGAAALPAVLQQPAGPEREPRRVALQLAADEAREALLRRHLRAGLLHAVEGHLERSGQHSARQSRREPGRDLTVRERPERRDLADGYAPCAVGGVRLRAARRSRTRST